MLQKIGCAKTNILCVIVLVVRQKHSAEAWSYSAFPIAEICLKAKE